MNQLLTLLIIFFSVLLICLVLIQAKGVGLGRTLGSTAYHSRRGLEKLVFRATIIVSIIFAALSIANQFLP